MEVIEIIGPIEAFDGYMWVDRILDVPIEVSIIGEHQSWTHALVVGDVPIRWLTDNPAMKVLTTEASAL
jgi:hypothetical protein